MKRPQGVVAVVPSAWHKTLVEHLAWWGLRRCDSDAAYDHWQAETIPADALTRLRQLAAAKSRPDAGVAEERQFYDLAATAGIISVLYSQRYDFYLTVGPLVTEHLTGSHTVLDFGCGPGILTTFYARQHPSLRIVGIDRSSKSIAMAREQAARLRLENVAFESWDVDDGPPRGRYDLILATHALLQTERDPGLPSRDWRSFERAADASRQDAFEERTGLGRRLDHLGEALAADGRLVIVEKAYQLGRRVPFQRALARRGFVLVHPPRPIRYQWIEETTDDGPLYVVAREGTRRWAGEPVSWSEDPQPDENEALYWCVGEAAKSLKSRWRDFEEGPSRTWWEARLGRVEVTRARASGGLASLFLTAADAVPLLVSGPRDTVEALPVREVLERWTHEQTASQPDDHDWTSTPLYENHTVRAQAIWLGLADRQVLKESTRRGPDGRQMHVEVGRTAGLVYLYGANTFDQRQIVIVEPARAALLEQYYQEIQAEPPVPSCES